MYLHLGHNTVVTQEEIIGIFDLDNTTVSRRTRDFLSKAQKEGSVISVSMDLPKSFIVCKDKRIYLSQLSPATLQLRLEKRQNGEV